MIAVCFVSLVGDLRARGFVVLGWVLVWVVCCCRVACFNLVCALVVV